MKILKTLLIVPLAGLLAMPVYAAHNENYSRSESHQERHDSSNHGKPGRIQRKKQDNNLHKASHKTYKHKHNKHKSHDHGKYYGHDHGKYYRHDHGNHYGWHKKRYGYNGHNHGYGRYGYGNQLYDRDGWSLILRLSDEF